MSLYVFKNFFFIEVIPIIFEQKGDGTRNRQNQNVVFYFLVLNHVQKCDKQLNN